MNFKKFFALLVVTLQLASCEGVIAATVTLTENQTTSVINPASEPQFKWTQQTNWFSSILRYTGSVPTAGFILTADATGNATWQPASSAGTGVTNIISTIPWINATLTAAGVFTLSTNATTRIPLATASDSNGTTLTNLNASNIASGTLPDARLSAAVVLTSGVQTITGNKTFTSLLTANAGITNLGDLVSLGIFSAGNPNLNSFHVMVNSNLVNSTLRLINYNPSGNTGFTLTDPNSDTANLLMNNQNGSLSLSTSQGNVTIQAAGSGNIVTVNPTITTNGGAFNVQGNTTLAGTLLVSGASTFNGTSNAGNSTITGNLTVNGNTTLGDAAADTITANASTMAIPNFLNIGSSTLMISNNTIGVGTALTGATNGIYFPGTVDSGILVNGNFTAGNNAGMNATLRAGDATTNSLNTAGGDAIISAGSSHGSGTGRVRLFTAQSGAGGTTLHNPTEVLTVSGGAFGFNEPTPDATYEFVVSSSPVTTSNLWMISSSSAADGDYMIMYTNGVTGFGIKPNMSSTFSFHVANMSSSNDVRALGQWVNTSTAPAINQITTNGIRRLYVSADVLMTTTTGSAQCKLVQITGSTTNIIQFAQAGTPASSEIRPVGGFINPSALYIFSNFSTGDGAITITNFNTTAF